MVLLLRRRRVVRQRLRCAWVCLDGRAEFCAIQCSICSALECAVGPAINITILTTYLAPIESAAQQSVHAAHWTAFKPAIWRTFGEAECAPNRPAKRAAFKPPEFATLNVANNATELLSYFAAFRATLRSTIRETNGHARDETDVPTFKSAL